MTLGDLVFVGLCEGHTDPQRWVMGVVVAVQGSIVAVRLEDRDWIGPVCYVRKRPSL